MDVLPLRSGDSGPAVRDLQQRLTALGLDTSVEPQGAFGAVTAAAVRSFQAQRGLPASGECDVSTWTAVLEAGYRSGDRLIYLKSPMTRGDDVADLQRALGTLGFDAGRVDGIFGPIGDRALRDFQRNAGLTSDGVGGPLVMRALEQLGRPTGRHTNVAGVRERERLRAQPPRLTDCRVVIGEGGGLDVLVTAIDRGLRDSGALVAVLHHPQPSVQAVEANDFRADVYLGLALVDHSPCEAAYYSTPGFISEGGRQLAQLLVAQIRSISGLDVVEPHGRWLPILRETRMPSVFCTLGPPDRVVTETAALAAAVHHALKQWVSEPIQHEP